MSFKNNESLLRVKPIIVKSGGNVPIRQDISSSYLFNVPVNQLSKLYQCRKELEEADEHLRQLKQSGKFQELDRMWDKLVEKQKQFQSVVIEGEQFLIANKEKRNRVMERIADYKRIYNQHCSNIEDMQEEYDKAFKVKSVLEKKNRQFKIYEEYLESAIALTPRGTFKSPFHLISKYNRLLECKQKVGERESRAVKLYADELMNMRKTLYKKSTIIIELVRKVDLLRHRHFVAKQSVLVYEEIVDRVKNNLSKVVSETAQVKQCCNNIYQSICRRTNRPIVEGSSMDYKLRVISQEMKTLKCLLKSNQEEIIRMREYRRKAAIVQSPQSIYL